MTPLQRWRFRRNLVIYLAWRAGVSQRVLADVFDLPRSRIAVILKRLRARVAERGRGDDDAGATHDCRWASIRDPEVSRRPGTRMR